MDENSNHINFDEDTQEKSHQKCDEYGDIINHHTDDDQKDEPSEIDA